MVPASSSQSLDAEAFLLLGSGLEMLLLLLFLLLLPPLVMLWW